MRKKIPCGQRPLLFDAIRSKKTSSLVVKLLQASVEHSVSARCTEDISHKLHVVGHL